MERVYSRFARVMQAIVALSPMVTPLLIYRFDFDRIESVFGYEFLFYFTVWYVIFNFIVDRFAISRIFERGFKVLSQPDMRLTVKRYILVIISCLILYFISKTEYGFLVIVGGIVGNFLLPKLYYESLFESDEAIICRARFIQYDLVEKFEKTTAWTFRIEYSGKMKVFDLSNRDMMKLITKRLSS